MDYQKVLKLHSYAWDLTGCPHKADDLVQDTLVRILHKKVACDDKALLKTIMLRIFIDQKRKLFISKKRLHPYYKNRVFVTIPAQPDDILISKEQLNKVTDTIQKMNLKIKDTLILHRVYGLKYREIAVLTKVSINTALGRIRYADKYLNELN